MEKRIFDSIFQNWTPVLSILAFLLFLSCLWLIGNAPEATSISAPFFFMMFVLLGICDVYPFIIGVGQLHACQSRVFSTFLELPKIFNVVTEFSISVLRYYENPIILIIYNKTKIYKNRSVTSVQRSLDTLFAVHELSGGIQEQQCLCTLM